MQTTTSTETESATCNQCGVVCTPKGKHDIGYGRTPDGAKHCYSCCAAADKETMKRDGKITLYLVKRDDGWWVTNWPGSLNFPCGSVSEGRHNIARVQRTTYFCGPDGSHWIARQYGDNTEVAHCRRLKD